MPTIAVNPFMLRDCLFQVAADNYEAHVSQVEFVPSTTKATYKGLTPAAVFTFSGGATWLCNLGYAQDWATANSLARYLHEHEGETVEVTFEPLKGGTAITASIIIEPGSIGGTVDNVASSTVSLGVNGKPALEPAA